MSWTSTPSTKTLCASVASLTLFHSNSKSPISCFNLSIRSEPIESLFGLNWASTNFSFLCFHLYQMMSYLWRQSGMLSMSMSISIPDPSAGTASSFFFASSYYLSLSCSSSSAFSFCLLCSSCSFSLWSCFSFSNWAYWLLLAFFSASSWVYISSNWSKTFLCSGSNSSNYWWTYFHLFSILPFLGKWMFMFRAIMMSFLLSKNLRKSFLLFDSRIWLF